jgi:hypothetical protein
LAVEAMVESRLGTKENQFKVHSISREKMGLLELTNIAE